MIKIYLTNDGAIEQIDKPEKNCWICMTHPTEKELDYIANLYSIEMDDLSAALDDEETSRIEVEDNYRMVLVDIPTEEERNGKKRYITIPLAIIVTKDVIITVCLEKTSVLDFFTSKKSLRIDTGFKTRLLLQILLQNASLYLKDLRIIYKQSEEMQLKLQESTENQTLIDMMELGKSLLYFTTSLKSNAAVIDRLVKFNSIKKYEEDEDLLEDVVIEYKQATEMSEVYSGILNGMMDAYASVISNNMNVVQKFLAIATVVLSIPNIISGLYGMNIMSGALPFADNPLAFWIVIGISLLASLGVWFYFRHKKMY